MGGTHPSKCPNCSEKACASDFSVRLLLHRRSILLELPKARVEILMGLGRSSCPSAWLERAVPTFALA